MVIFFKGEIMNKDKDEILINHPEANEGYYEANEENYYAKEEIGPYSGPTKNLKCFAGKAPLKLLRGILVFHVNTNLKTLEDWRAYYKDFEQELEEKFIKILWIPSDTFAVKFEQLNY